MRQKSPAEWLKSVRAFAAIPDQILKRLYAECHLQTVARGESLLKAGDIPDALYIVTSGRFRTSRFATEPGRAELGPGSVLAEKAFFSRQPQEAGVTAIRASIVLKLEWESFKTLAEGASEVWQATIQSLVTSEEKLPAQPHRLSDRARSLAICPAGGEAVPPDFVARLAEVIEQRAECQVLSSEGLGQNLPGGIALDDPQVVHWMKEQESRFDVIVLLADAEPTAWTEKAIAEADEICLIGTHDGARLGSPVPLSPVEEMAFEMRGADACRLALFHNSQRKDAICGTRRWLEYRPVRSHHHLRPNEAKDYERLARFLLGQSVGFFASAAGVLGGATLGVYKAVQASGFEPDCFAGTGAGAVMAACLALGMDADDIDQLVTEIMVDKRALRRRHWPLLGLYDQRMLDRMILKHFPDTDLADLPIPFYAASGNLSTGEEHLHHSGNLQVVVRANWPFPGLLPPFIDEEGQMLIDGTILNPPPIAPMHRLNSGPNVIARAEIPPFGRSPIRYRDLPAWQKNMRSWRHWLPGEKTSEAMYLPSYENLLIASCIKTPDEKSWMGPLDMMLSAPIPAHMDVLAWHEHSQLKDRSYQWALGELEKRAAAGDLTLTAAVPNA